MREHALEIVRVQTFALQGTLEPREDVAFFWQCVLGFYVAENIFDGLVDRGPERAVGRFWFGEHEKVALEENSGAGVRDVEEILEVRDAHLIFFEERHEERLFIGHEGAGVGRAERAHEKCFGRRGDGVGDNNFGFEKRGSPLLGREETERLVLFAAAVARG